MDSLYQYEKRRDFVFNITRLSLWYAHYHTKHGESFGEILNCRTPIYRLTTLWDGVHHPANPDFPTDEPEWNKLVDSLLQLYRKTKSDVARFEEDGFNLLRPHIEGRIEKDISDWPWIPCGYVPYKLPDEQVFGIFAYEMKSPRQELISFHIANSCIPQSPFKDMLARSGELLAMIRDIRSKVPSAAMIGCSSWLNSFPPFLQLFPASYSGDDLTVGNVSYGFSWWGQFMSRDGSFHEKHGNRMRQTGTFPFLCRGGKCSITELETYLLDTFNIAKD